MSRFWCCVLSLKGYQQVTARGQTLRNQLENALCSTTIAFPVSDSAKTARKYLRLHQLPSQLESLSLGLQNALYQIGGDHQKQEGIAAAATGQCRRGDEPVQGIPADNR